MRHVPAVKVRFYVGGVATYRICKSGFKAGFTGLQNSGRAHPAAPKFLLIQVMVF
jgi:hypothetical protein